MLHTVTLPKAKKGDSMDVVRTSIQHMNYKNTSIYDNPKDFSLCNIFILKKY